jgi:hypothetical protein
LRHNARKCNPYGGSIPRPRQSRPADVQRRLEAFARDYARRDADLRRLRNALRAERDDAIRAAHRDGLPLQDIAAIVGLSHQYVSRIVRG